MNGLLIGTGTMAREISTGRLAGGHDVLPYNPARTGAEKLADELRSSNSALRRPLRERASGDHPQGGSDCYTDRVDDALDGTFPASDPPPWTLG